MNPPAIVRASETVLVSAEQAVARFPRLHRYQVGGELRTDARSVAKLARKAWRNPAPETIGALSDGIDDLKLSLSTALRVGAMSFAQFEALSLPVNSLGRQCGGWQKKHLAGQSRTAHAPLGRAPILSAGDASQGANR
jgi:hypothetical protein